MKRKVVYVGGPMCGRAERLQEDDIVGYIAYECNGKQWYYKHVLRTASAGPLRVQHRYLFCGHRPKLPTWLKNQVAKEKRANG
jgi:hypothetical protein